MEDRSGARISRKAFIPSVVIIFILMMVAGILTRIIPTGQYTRIEVNGRVVIILVADECADFPQVVRAELTRPVRRSDGWKLETHWHLPCIHLGRVTRHVAHEAKRIESRHVSLSGILCARQGTPNSSMYARQWEDDESGCGPSGGDADDSRGTD